MRWLLPKSLNGFLLLGLGMLAAPLLLMILQATVQMRRLSEASQRLVIDSVQTARLIKVRYSLRFGEGPRYPVMPASACWSASCLA